LEGNKLESGRGERIQEEEREEEEKGKVVGLKAV
jgi:hypothetical protein